MPSDRTMEDLRFQAGGAPPGASMGDPDIVTQVRLMLSQLPPEQLMQLSQMPPDQIRVWLEQENTPPDIIDELIRVILMVGEEIAGAGSVPPQGPPGPPMGGGMPPPGMGGGGPPMPMNRGG